MRKKRGTLPREERDDGVDQGGEEAAEVDEGEDRVEQRPRGSYLTTVAERIVIGSSGTFVMAALAARRDLGDGVDDVHAGDDLAEGAVLHLVQSEDCRRG